MKREGRQDGNATNLKKKKASQVPSADDSHESEDDADVVSRKRVSDEGEGIVSSQNGKKIRPFLRGDDDYLPGNIIKIELRNFMTYDYIQTLPGPRLNLIIGPNGSGKSSLVCAICIGLGGDPKLLGRAVNVGEYVQRGFDKSTIKITLRGESAGRNFEITRKISATNKADWMLNGSPCRREDIKNLVQKFNIQIDNLTQFLPQDKVCEFAKLSAVDLLKETEKAVGDPELFAQHEFLVSRKDELFKMNTSVEQTRKSLESLKSENGELEKDVERMAQRESILQKVELMRKKLPWLVYDKAKRDYLAVKEIVKESKAAHEEALSEHRILEGPFRKVMSKKDATSNQIELLKDAIKVKAQEKNRLFEKEEELSLKVTEKVAERDQLLRTAENHKQKLLKAEEAFNQAKLAYESFQAEELDVEKTRAIENQISELYLESEGLGRKIKEKRYSLDEKARELNRIRERLKEAESWHGRIITALVNMGERSLNESLSWLKDNRSMFKGAVFGPIAAEVDVPDPQHAKYLEQQVPQFVWKAFVVTCKEDRDLLMKRIKVDVINCGNSNPSFPPAELPEKAIALGVTHRLDQVLKCHPIIFSVLRAQAGLHRSFIGNESAENNAQSITRLGISDLWTPQNHYRWSRSAYHNDVITTSYPVRACRIFSGGSREEIIHLQREGAEVDDGIKAIQSLIQEVEGQRQVLNARCNGLEKERDEIMGKVSESKRRRRDLLAHAEKCKNIVASLKKLDDPSLADERLLKEISNLNDKRHSLVMQMTKVVMSMAADHMAIAPLQLSWLELDVATDEIQDQLKESKSKVDQAVQKVAEMESRRSELQSRLREALEAGKRVVDLEQHPEVEEQFVKLPGSIEELEDAIASSETEANSILCPNPDVMVQYERRKKQIQELAARLEVQESSLQTVKSDIESVQGKWLPRLQGLVARINETFSKNFAEMAVAGEVRLDEHGMEFDKYGVHILVKFRESGELQVLSATHQSGGERSVSTILYLVSLQAITHCPFRVVDEINQGMDLHNERKMFQQLVRAASLPNTPQCFLLTPKLLPDLDYGPACSVLNIMNGPYVSDVLDGGFRAGESLSSVLRKLEAS